MPSANGHGPKRAVLYARVSTDEQARSGYSLAQQVEALRSYAAREGYEVFEEVQDPGQSGATLERPGMDRVRDLVAAGGVSVVLAQDLDRISREPWHYEYLRSWFTDHGTQLRTLEDGSDNSPMAEFVSYIRRGVAKLERSDIAKRSRRGQLQKAREGKVLAGRRPKYGFKLNATRDGYEVDEENMRVVRRIFEMVGVESRTLHAVKRALEREGEKSPDGKSRWAAQVIRHIILDDVYRPHSYEETASLVSTGVAARLESGKRYGVWWYNRHRITRKQVADDGPEGRYYRHVTKTTEKDRSEWIAVPVQSSSIPREWVDAAREAIRNNKRPSSAGRRYWELSGGVFRCGSCASRMTAETAWGSRSSAAKKYFYYKCPKARRGGPGSCPHNKGYRAEKVELLVWDFVSDLLKEPEKVREGIEEMIKRERDGAHGDPDQAAKACADKLAETDRKRARFQDMSAEGLITFDELRAKLATLEEDREVARRGLKGLEEGQARLRDLEKDKDTLLDYYGGLVPKVLDDLAPEERYHIYKLLKLTVNMHPDGMLGINGVLGKDLGLCDSEPSLRRRLSPRVSRSGRSRSRRSRRSPGCSVRSPC
jgi:site-specific DNA recombinase